jgi:hypothetical protein
MRSARRSHLSDAAPETTLRAGRDVKPTGCIGALHRTLRQQVHATVSSF